ncbi:hypothetical protein K491DRAFT_172633 [Lophiostoma macrostomum CBS 122681]|uniref:Uncharacterized protein n=1 Tax=Lophiostoma macrostomum CBS 122681 TaxID=1314788 RepID=A0A6A6SPB0_9PLEO|nr:hypothetical protein K491DRAFT_172633 [Lophiostoma macrostomum CBS 122681]
MSPRDDRAKARALLAEQRDAVVKEPRSKRSREESGANTAQEDERGAKRVKHDRASEFTGRGKSLSSRHPGSDTNRSQMTSLCSLRKLCGMRSHSPQRPPRDRIRSLQTRRLASHRRRPGRSQRLGMIRVTLRRTTPPSVMVSTVPSPQTPPHPVPNMKARFPPMALCACSKTTMPLPAIGTCR